MNNAKLLISVTTRLQRLKCTHKIISKISKKLLNYSPTAIKTKRHSVNSYTSPLCRIQFGTMSLPAQKWHISLDFPTQWAALHHDWFTQLQLHFHIKLTNPNHNHNRSKFNRTVVYSRPNHKILCKIHEFLGVIQFA